MKRWISFFPGLLVLLLLNACSYQYFLNTADESLQRARIKSNYVIERKSDWVIHSNTAVTLVQPVHIKSKVMPRNLYSLYQALDLSLKQAFPAYSTHSGAVTLDEALNLAQRDASELLFWPTLVSIENKINTEQELREGKDLNNLSSYGPDRAVFQVLIYEVRTRHLLDVGSVRSRGRMLAPNGSLPLDLYPDAANRYMLAITGQ